MVLDTSIKVQCIHLVENPCFRRDIPSGQNLADSAGNPQGFWLLMEGIHMEIWVVSETRIHKEIQGKFSNRR